MDNVRIGIIGAGQNTRRRHIPGFQAIDGVEIGCVANRTGQSARRVADEFGIPRVHEHWHDVVADPEIDAVCIGTWPYLHAPATCAALAAGKHVLCEARMATNATEARRMQAAAQQSGRIAMLVPSPFGLVGDRVIRELLAGGFVGAVREICVRALSASMVDAAAPLHWRQRADLSGVNTLTLGIVNETVQRWFGRTESVVAQASCFVPRRVDPASGLLQDVDIPDSIAVLARMTGGAQCVYHVSGHAHHGGPTQIEIYGAAGTVIYNLEGDSIRGAPAGEPDLKPIDIPADKAGGWQVEADFIAAVRDQRSITFTSFSDGVKYMCFTEAVRRAADAGRRVWLSEV